MKYKVSVIIPAYNAEKSIERAVQSIYSQNVDGIQIIIVNDGSKDATLEIIEKIQSQKNNILIVNQENSGVSAARNKGLQMARGEYVTFLDADDEYPKNTFEKIYKFISSEKADIFIGNIECFNDVRVWQLSYMKKLFKGKKKFITTLDKNPEIQYSPSVCNKWFKRELLKDMTFDLKLGVGEDLLFTEQCYLKADKIIAADWLTYKYRVVKVDSLSKKSSISFFRDLIFTQKKVLELFKDRKRINEASLIMNRQLDFFVSSIFLKIEGLAEDLDEVCLLGIELFNISKEFVQFPLTKDIEKNFISFLFHQQDKKNLLIFLRLLCNQNVVRENVLKNKKPYSYLYSYFPEYEKMLCIKPESLVRVEDIALKGTNLSIMGYAFVKGFSTDIQKKKIIFTNNKTGEIKEQPLQNELRTDLTYLFKRDGVSYDQAGFQSIEINLMDFLEDGVWDVAILIEIGECYSVTSKLLVPLAEIKNKAKVQISKTESSRKGVFCSYEEGKYLKVQVSSLSLKAYLKTKIGDLKRNLRNDIGFIKKRKYKIFLAILSYRFINQYLRNKEIWLMGERPDTAQDNTYHLFCYLRKNKPALNTYYVIKKGSKDREDIENFGNIINFGSLKHTLYLLCAKNTINSYVERPNMYTDEYKEIIKYYPEFVQNNKVFLQHGVIGVSRVNHVLHKNRVNYNLFITSSQFEKNHIMQEFGYTEQEVAVTGLPRWDKLDRKLATKKILLMPTWRSWIQSEEELELSQYFNRYMDLIRNRRLIQLLEEYDYELIFYPHYQIQKLLSDRFLAFHERIQIVKQGDRKVQELLNECELLLTDYSTVSFDFAYMEKPVIFYQFDYSEFYSRHYNEGPIQHKKQLFGPVVEDLEDVLAGIEEYLLKRENKIEFKEKIGLFIEKQDKSHTEKVFNEIEKIDNRK